jgi:hypothetical protein
MWSPKLRVEFTNEGLTANRAFEPC